MLVLYNVVLLSKAVLWRVERDTGEDMEGCAE
jgi:hypothetical protein